MVFQEKNKLCITRQFSGTARAEAVWEVILKMKINLLTNISGSPVCP